MIALHDNNKLKPPVRSLRGAFLATKQSQPFYEGIASAKNASQ